MLNQHFIFENSKTIQKNIKKRNLSFNNKYFSLLYIKKKQLLNHLNYILINKKKNLKLFFKKKIHSINNFKEKKQYTIIQKIYTKIKKELNNFLLLFPNILHKSVPNEKEKIVKIQHYQLQKNIWTKYIIKQFDSKNAIQIAGKKFSILNGKIAQLHRALAQFMLDLHCKKHNYIEFYMPFLVNTNTLYNSGHLPRFKNDQFKIDKSNLWLSPTSEVQLVTYNKNKTYEEKKLPLNMVCLTTCFRKEIGNYGKETQGLIRQHQFEKVELVKVCKHTTSYKELLNVRKHAETILKKLKIPYQIKLLNSKNTGFSSAKTYDIEAWLPITKKYLEISSCSNTTNFQSLRLKTYWKKTKKKNKYLTHLINGSGVAVGRTLLAVLENYQINNTKIKIPNVLKKYIKDEFIILT